MLHRMLLFDQSNMLPLCDLSFTRDVSSEPGMLIKTFQALIKFSRDSA